MMRTDGSDCLAELKRRRDGVYYVVLVVYVCMRSVGADSVFDLWMDYAEAGA